MLSPITEVEISKIVEKLPSKISMRHDGISNILDKSFFILLDIHYALFSINHLVKVFIQTNLN